MEPPVKLLVEETDAVLKELMDGDLAWGNAALLTDSDEVRRLGVKDALKSRIQRSSSRRRTSSGRTSSIQRKEGRKGRQEHYKRKAILEREKEEERRREWLASGASESKWRRKEERRKARKAWERQTRKAMKTKRSSSYRRN